MNRRKGGSALLWLVVLISGLAVLAFLLLRFGDFDKIDLDGNREISEDPKVQELEDVGTSDEAQDIEVYLEDTNLDGIDEGLEEVDQSLKSL